MPIECMKRVDPCQCMYGCIVGVGDKKKDFIPGFMAWINASSNLPLEGLLEAFLRPFVR